mgnify:CR=1 FL=1
MGHALFLLRFVTEDTFGTFSRLDWRLAGQGGVWMAECGNDGCGDVAMWRCCGAVVRWCGGAVVRAAPVSSGSVRRQVRPCPRGAVVGRLFRYRDACPGMSWEGATVFSGVCA